MEPLTILGLVSNIVQLVDAAANAATACHQIHKRGASCEDLQIADTSNKLSRCCSTLDDALATQPSVSMTKSHIDLADLSAKCRQVAQDLHNELEELSNLGGGRRKTIRKYLQRQRKAKKLESLKNRLDEYRKTLDTVVSVDIRHIVAKLSSQQEKHNGTIDQKLSELVTSLATCRISAADNLKKEVDGAIEANRREHELTRSHIRSHFDTTVHQLTATKDQQLELQKKHDLFLESLRFDDLNARQNEVSESHPKTFAWIFDDKIGHSWDSFQNWLEGDQNQNVYWINGKAGSGKSTLMKFITSDHRTHQALKVWSNGKECVVLTFYFWLSGSKLQRSMKGLLCSLVRQLLTSNAMILEQTWRTDELLSRKRTISDWSVNELHVLLYSIIPAMSGMNHICFFLDGIDEFDQNEDVQQVLHFIQRLSELQHVKLCVSSRPEAYLEKWLSRYCKLRLQDLTAYDMEICARDALQDAVRDQRLRNVTDKDIKNMIDDMTFKADGVFLWTHLALKSILRGFGNEDNAQELFRRLENLPSGMEQLYNEMWSRLNDDQPLYRKEASLYFSFHEYFPLSLFELMVAINSEIQNAYLKELKPRDPTVLIENCNALRTKISTRCAGLLEVEPIKDKKKLGESEECANQNLREVYHMSVRFLHRTARDFLLNTEAGHKITGEPLLSLDDRFANITRAWMASLLEGLRSFTGTSIHNVFISIEDFETERELDLVTDLRYVCETLNVPDSGNRDIRRSSFWKSRGQDFHTVAASYGCLKYVKYFLEHERKHVSSYYKGSLFLHTASQYSIPNFPRRYKLANLLANLGADLHTAQIFGDTKTTPYKHLLGHILASTAYYSVDAELATQIALMIAKGFPYDLDSADTYITWTSAGQSLEVDLTQADPNDKEYMEDLNFAIEIGVVDLYRAVMYRLKRRGARVESTRPIPTVSHTPTKVLAIVDYSKDLSVITQDSIYLGEAYERILLPESYPDTPVKIVVRELTARFKEVILRCEEVDWRAWNYKAGILVKRHKDALTLDPSEEVNESNWREKLMVLDYRADEDESSYEDDYEEMGSGSDEDGFDLEDQNSKLEERGSDSKEDDRGLDKNRKTRGEDNHV